MFNTSLKKMSFLVALFIAFLLSLAAPSAAMAEVETGWSVAQKHGLSAVYAEPAIYSDRQKEGAKDTALDVYSVFPVMDRNIGGALTKNEPTILFGKGGAFAYKDRPGWRM